jgi:GH25 family lysozyme M1 (1,4-beta-N-acetylmuramidase)
MALRGIDVSTYQGSINWSAVKASGIDFAIVKATQGHAVNSNSYLFTDRHFANNVTGAHDVGLKVGVYHYLTAKTIKEAQTEAQHFIDTIAPYKPRIELWAAVDVEEDKYLPRNKKLLSDIVEAFCAYVAAEGYRPMVYTNPNYLTWRFDKIPPHDLWLALWRDKTRTPTGYDNMQIWQYGAETVKGINGNVDANYGYFDVAVEDVPPMLITPIPELTPVFETGDRVKVRAGKNYLYGTTRKFVVWFREYEVISAKGDRVVIGKKGKVTAAVDAENLTRVV